MSMGGRRTMVAMMAIGTLLVAVGLVGTHPPSTLRGAERVEAPMARRNDAASRSDKPSSQVRETLAKAAAATPKDGLSSNDENTATGAAPELSEEEQSVLRDHSLDELPHLIAQAEQSYREARAADRSEAQRRYLVLLNLASKVVANDGPSPSEALVARQQQYLAARESEQQRIAQLPPAEQQKRLAAFKENFFRDLTESENAPPTQEKRP